MKRRIKNSLLNWKLKRRNVKIHLRADVDLSNEYEGNNVINQGAKFRGELGLGSYIGAGSNIRGRIGRYCSIGSHVQVINGNHPTSKFVSTHPAFFSVSRQAGFTYVDRNLFDELTFADKEKKYEIWVGNDVWIGSNSLILGGIKIGNGAVIAAGAVVIHDVPPYAVVAGIPAEIKHFRFTDDQIAFLQEFRWWDKPEEWIRQNALLFDNIEKWKSFFGEMRK